MAEERMLNDEILLGLIKANSGGGGGGTSDYSQLTNKPQINGTTLTGNKSASDLSLASTADLAGKQGVLTAGDYITINNDTIGVSKSKNAGYSVYEYRFITVDTGSAPKVKIQKYIDDVLISDTTYNEFQVQPKITVDDLFEFWYSAAHWYYKTLVASNEHPIDTTVDWAWNQTVSYTETWNITGESVTDLMTRGDVQDLTGDLSNLATTTKTDLVSAVNEVNTGLSGKQDTLTFDDTPTDNSNNPVKSNGVYDALALKQDKTDNTLQTTDKTVVGAVNELKSGLTNLSEEVNGDATTYPYADVITIEDAVPSNLADCSVKIEPVQDLHGYDKPWVGGAGKNKFVYPYGNTTKTENNVTFTDNGDGTVTVVTTSSGASNDTEFVLCNSSTGTSITLPTGNYILNGCPANGSTSSYWISVYKTGQNIGNDVGSGYSFTSTDELFSLSIRVKEGTIISSAMTFKPMIRLVAETDATFAPYENICPITGHTEASVEVTDGDETTKTYTIALGDTIYGGTVDFDSGVMTVDRAILGVNDFAFQSGTSAGGLHYAQATISPNTDTCISNMLETKGSNSSWNSETPCVNVSKTNSRCRVYVEETSGTDFATNYADLQVCYELATPTTIQLTPQQIQLLQGQNTLTASTGDISVTVNGVSGAIGELTEDVNELAEDVENITSVRSATAGTNVTIDGGGYITVGNMVIVNIEFTADDNIASNTVLLNLPNELLTNTPINIYDKSTYDMLSKGRIYNGKLMASEQIVSSNSYYAAGVYIKS